MRSGNWRDYTVKTLNWRESTIGIIGLGNIGLQLAQMCTALGMNVIYSGRTPKDVPYGYRSLEGLLGEADCVVLTCPLSEETRGLMCERTFGMMKDGSILVNVGELTHLAIYCT